MVFPYILGPVADNAGFRVAISVLAVPAAAYALWPSTSTVAPLRDDRRLHSWRGRRAYSRLPVQNSTPAHEVKEPPT